MRTVVREGGAPSDGLDARLLRFRNRPDAEEAVALAGALLDGGRVREALEVTSRGLSLHADDPRLLVLEARAWLREGELLRAQALLLRAARRAADAREPLRWLGEVLLKRGDPARAVKVLERARHLDASDPEIRRLHERASRLAQIAAQAGEASAARPLPAADDDEKTATMLSATLSDPFDSQTRIDVQSPDRGGAEAVSHEDLDDTPTTGSAKRHESARRTAAPPPVPVPRSPAGTLRATPAPAPSLPVRMDAAPTQPPAGSAAEPAAALRGSGEPLASSALATEPDATVPPMPVSAPVREPAPHDEHGTPPDEEETRGGRRGDRRSAPAALDAEGMLEALQRQGLFESTSDPAAEWAPAREAPRVGTRIGRVLLVLWAIVLLLAGGGWYGWTRWVEHRHAEGARLVAQATEEALTGDHKRLVDAERHLRQARELHPRDPSGARALLFVHAQRALEDGAFEPGYLRPTIARAERLQVTGPLFAAARAVLAAAEADMESAAERLEEALQAEDPGAQLLYIAGRLEQRLGQEEALAHLRAAAEAVPGLVAAQIALAEALTDQGQPDEALIRLQGVLERHPHHLRATLWETYLTADEVDPDEGLQAVDRLAERLEEGAPTDQVLAELTRARFRRRKGQLEVAAAAVERAAEAGATEPRLLALVAASARALGELTRAQQAATQAVGGAPSNPDFRKMLAEILLERRNGVGALRTLTPLSDEDPEVLRLSARAALLVGTGEALGAADEALAAFLEEHPGDGAPDMRALLVRLRVRRGQGAEVFDDARALAKEAPGDPLVTKALGEAALAVFQPALALDALGRLVKAAPDDADTHYLLGRAYRMAGDADDSEQSFRKGLELEPNHTPAAVALGYLLLDRGRFDDADAVYQRLAQRRGVASGESTVLVGRIGRVEALVGLGRLEDAEVQLETVRAADRESTAYRVAAARLALARGNPGEAVTLVRSVVEQNGGPGAKALYGEALYQAGEVAAASEQYDAVLADDPGHPEALVGRIQVLVRAEKARDALSNVERALESLERRIRPPRLRAKLLTLVGRAHLMRGRRSIVAAREALRGATAVEGAPAEAWFFLGEALAGANAPEARRAYERYLELAPEGEYAARARRAIR